MSLIWNREDFDSVLADPRTTPVEKDALLYVNQVREFARTRIGLKVSDTFTTYTRLDREAVAWNVTAARPYRLEPRTWWFPVVGTVPYLGFFSREEAQEKATELEEEGLDVLVSIVPAYSTLGWFSDPLLSTQIRYSRWFLTRLVIHESVHGTIWFPGDVTFNESLASFVEMEGALQFYKEIYGDDSKELGNIHRLLEERKLYKKMMFETANELKELYSEIKDVRKLKERKNVIIESLQSKMAGKKADFKFYDMEKLSKEKLNNASFLSYIRYSSGSHFFQKTFKKVDNDWNRFFKEMEKLKSMGKLERSSLLAENKQDFVKN